MLKAKCERYRWSILWSRENMLTHLFSCRQWQVRSVLDRNTDWHWCYREQICHSTCRSHRSHQYGQLNQKEYRNLLWVWGWDRKTRLKDHPLPSGGLLTFPRRYFFCGSFSILLCVGMLICALWSPAEKELTSCSRWWCLSVSLSLSHWYTGLGVVLDCIDCWSLHPYLLCWVE